MMLFLKYLVVGSFSLVLAIGFYFSAENNVENDGSKFQYKFEGIKIPGARSNEPRRQTVSVKLASQYIEQGTEAWIGSKKCVTCHTNGTYMALRPSLTRFLGKPNEQVREFFLKFFKTTASSLGGNGKLGDSQLIYIARGFAEWDAHVSGKLSNETRLALNTLFERQLPSGSWKAAQCWPPLESSAFQEATVAALAVGIAPGWLSELNDEKVKLKVERLRHYLSKTNPPHDYGRVVLLWASSRMTGLLSEDEKTSIINRIWQLQRPDGGWSIRTFADPEQWGDGNRAEKLRSEIDFEDPPSDGHQTGLVLIVLSEVGIGKNDPRIRRGVEWLLRNQRQSGRWWTRSLNTDTFHFITYSGTLYPLVALFNYNAIPEATFKSVLSQISQEGVFSR